MINVSVNMFQLNYQKLTCLHNSEWCTNAVSYCKSRPESRIASGSRSSTQLSSPDHWNLSFATALRCSLPFLSRFTVLCWLNSSQTYFENNVLINEKKVTFELTAPSCVVIAVFRSVTLVTTRPSKYYLNIINFSLQLDAVLSH